MRTRTTRAGWLIGCLSFEFPPFNRKPVFIRHRTADEIADANKVDIKTLRDTQNDVDRVQRPEWLVMLGVCTHLGCVPLGQAGDCESSQWWIEGGKGGG